MIKNLRKIVVVGGGSAGWMSACFLKKTLPEKQVVVIESPNIPTIGVGESTLGGIKPFLNILNLDENDFMKSTDASYKLSIKFTDFYKKHDGGFQYPFGVPFEEETHDGMSDWFHKKALYPETPIQDLVHCFYPASHLFENNKFDLNHHGLFDNYDPFRDVAYHFDAVKFAAYLREKYSKQIGIEHILATVVDVIVDEDGIKELILDSGEKVHSDLYVDCTGFKSLLIGEALKQKFYPFDHILPNNRAWAAQVPYKNKEKELEGFTNCTAIQNGWVWNTPVWSRLGAGYVYSDKFVDPETAKEEFKQYLMHQMLCERTREEVDNLKFRDIPFRVGAYKKTFVKNVVAIGMSAGFIEPLESNGLYTVHEFLFKLVKILRRDFVNQYEIDLYNQRVFEQWMGFSVFISQHYSLSGRKDTEYWLANSKRSIVNTETSIFHDKIANNMFSAQKFTDKLSGINHISVGMHWLFATGMETQFENYNRSLLDKNIRRWENRKIKWQMASQNSLTLFEHEKRYIYGEV